MLISLHAFVLAWHVQCAQPYHWDGRMASHEARTPFCETHAPLKCNCRLAGCLIDGSGGHWRQTAGVSAAADAAWSGSAAHA